MAEKTKIEWCDKTASPWHGCAHVHAGCTNCYAETMARRNPATLGVWGPDGTRVKSKSFIENLKRWNREAASEGRIISVFASICDPFEDWQEPIEDSRGVQLWRRDDGSVTTSDHYPDTVALTMDDLRREMFSTIDQCPNLLLMLLTKRPENVRRMWAPVRGMGRCASFPDCTHPDCEPAKYRPNVYLITSISDQPTANAMVPHLLGCRDLVPVIGLSAEPLLGPVILHKYFAQCECGDGHGFTACPNTGGVAQTCTKSGCTKLRPLIRWVIVGGESGPCARPCHLAWVRSMMYQCLQAGVPLFVKQLGAQVRWMPRFGFCGIWPEHIRVDYERRGEDSAHRIWLRDPKGGDMTEWSEDLRVRQFPEVNRS